MLLLGCSPSSLSMGRFRCKSYLHWPKKHLFSFGYKFDLACKNSTFESCLFLPCFSPLCCSVGPCVTNSPCLIFPRSSMDLLMNAVDMLPDGFPFSSLLKNITRALASETQGNLMHQIYLISDSVWTVCTSCPVSWTRGSFIMRSVHSLFKRRIPK